MGAAGWGWERRAPGVKPDPWGAECRAAVLPEIPGPLFPPPSAFHPLQPHFELLWNVRIHLREG